LIPSLLTLVLANNMALAMSVARNPKKAAKAEPFCHAIVA
jgi:hypothetical protein